MDNYAATTVDRIDSRKILTPAEMLIPGRYSSALTSLIPVRGVLRVIKPVDCYRLHLGVRGGDQYQYPGA